MLDRLKFFDFEVFPNWWCCVVSDQEDSYPGGIYKNKFDKETELSIKSKMRVYTSDDPQAASKLLADLSIGVVCGYNIKDYDLRIAKGVFSGFSPQKLAIANEIIISHFAPEVAYKDAEHTRVASFLKFGWNGAEAWQDLLDDSVKTLKDKECSLGIDIRETTVPFDKPNLTPDDISNIIYYCKHDVYALHVLYVTTSKAYVDTKIQLCDTFGLPRKTGYTNTNANLACKVLEATRAHGTLISNPVITIRDPKLKEYLDKWLPQDIFNHLSTSAESKTFELFENEVSIGDGGLHSVYKVPKVGRITPGLYVESTDEYSMYNVDVSSCYPSVMLFCQAMSRGIQKPERLMEIYKKRLQLKLTPKEQWSPADKIFVPAAKLVLNTAYGAMGNKYLPLYDDYMRVKVCRVGQMILLAISNHLYKTIEGLKVIQTNTDGVLVYAKRNDYNRIKAIVDEFSELSQFAFEIEEDNKLWQLNVNNYVAVHPDGEIKNKGGAFVVSIYEKGTNKLRPLGNFCVPKAQMAFMVKGVNPVKHLLENTSVEDFCLSCTKGPTYTGMIQHNQDGDLELGKVSRVIAVTDERFGIVKKVKRDKVTKEIIKEDTVALCPPHALILNDALINYYIENGKIINKETNESYEIDFAYYARELDKALDIPWYSIVNEKIGFTKQFNL